MPLKSSGLILVGPFFDKDADFEKPWSLGIGEKEVVPCRRKREEVKRGVLLKWGDVVVGITGAGMVRPVKERDGR